MDELLRAIPDYALELKRELEDALHQPELTEQQTWGTVVAAAMASRSADLVEYALDKAKDHLSPAAVISAKKAAAFATIDTLRTRVPHQTESDAVDFGLWSIAAATICGRSERSLVTHSSTAAVLRIAAVMQALAIVMDAELASPTIPTVF